jgi:hypothetical protein
MDIVWMVLKDRASSKNIDSMQIPRDLSQTKLEKIIREAREGELGSRKSVKSHIEPKPEGKIARPSEADRKLVELLSDPDRSQARATAPQQRPASEIEAPSQIMKVQRNNSAIPTTGDSSEKYSLPPNASSNELRHQTCETNARLAPFEDVQLNLFGTSEREARAFQSQVLFQEPAQGPSAKAFNIIPQDEGKIMQMPSANRPLRLKPVASDDRHRRAPWWKKFLLTISKP